MTDYADIMRLFYYTSGTTLSSYMPVCKSHVLIFLSYRNIFKLWNEPVQYIYCASINYKCWDSGWQSKNDIS